MPPDQVSGFWGGSRAQRLHPRLVAEMLLDALEFDEEPRALLEHLRNEGFAPDFVRCKGYVGVGGTEAVAILPMLSFDLSRVAGLGVHRALSESDEAATATATIVRLSHGTNPLDFTLLTVGERRQVRRFESISFDRLREGDPRRLAMDLAEPEERRRMDGLRLGRLSRGRAIAAATIEDLAREERDIGFISDAEFTRLTTDAELYADVARLHSYLAAAAEKEPAAGCKGCTSTSSYVCTSTSCNISLGLAAETTTATRL